MMQKSKSGRDHIKLPVHIGIIMDGNGRWAKKRGLSRTVGHKQGAKTFQDISKHCRDIGIKYLTVYAFSTENWKRPKEEIDSIMDLLRSYLEEVYKHTDENIRLRFLGDREPLPADIRKIVDDVEAKSAKNTGITVNIGLNYGGRDEIVTATQALARQVAEGKLRPEDITDELFEDALYTRGQPDPDFIIRPSGEQRLSNFMLWQCAYSEFIYLDVLWPDFTPAHLDRAIEEFSGRNRRFGGI